MMLGTIADYIFYVFGDRSALFLYVHLHVGCSESVPVNWHMYDTEYTLH
jgi:hypothetical protein